MKMSSGLTLPRFTQFTTQLAQAIVLQVYDASAKVADELTGMDVLGMGIAYVYEERKLSSVR